jgi:mannose-6-phosphate isomerase-like protein (cupin superfamily)
MFVRDFRSCREITAGDGCRLRQLLNPLQDDLVLSYSFAIARLGPGESATLHRLKSSEVYYILTGRGEMEIDDETVKVVPGQAVYVPAEARQRIKNTGQAELGFICLVDPAWRSEDEEILE